MRTNAITGAATFVVTSLPDSYRYIVQGAISTPQFIKNLCVTGVSITGATIGGILGLKFGKPGAYALSMAGGVIGGLLTKAVADTIHKDDAENMRELIKIALLELSNEYLVQSQAEFDRIVQHISNDGAIDMNLLRMIYTVGSEHNDDTLRVAFAKLSLEYYFEVSSRNRLEVNRLGHQVKILGNEQLIIDSINAINCDLDSDSDTE